MMTSTRTKPTEHIGIVFKDYFSCVIPTYYEVKALGDTIIIKKDNEKILRLQLLFNYNTNTFDDAIIHLYPQSKGYQGKHISTLRTIGDIAFTLSLCYTKFFNDINKIKQ